MANFRDLFGYLVRRFPTELRLTGTNVPDNEARVARQIVRRMEALGQKPLHWNTIAQQLVTGGNVQHPHDHVRLELTNFIVAALQDKVPGVTPDWLNQPSVDALQRCIERGAAAHEAPGPGPTRGLPLSSGFARTLLRPDTLEHLRHNLCHTYVAYRYAFENAENGFHSALIAREVVTFSVRPGDPTIHFAMSFRTGGSHGKSEQLVFEGETLVLGQSLFCVGQHLETSDQNLVRGRAMFMTREQQVNKCRFGILSTTMAITQFAPCAACVLMLQADVVPDDLEEFRRRVTTIRPLDDFLRADFAALSPGERKMLKTFLSNRPREHNSRRQDMVLRLWLDRFGAHMPDIAERLYRSNTKAPLGANWAKLKLLEK